MDPAQPTIFLSSLPLPPEEGLVTLDVLGEPESVRGETKSSQEKTLEGKITLNPSANLILSLPPSANTESSPFSIDRSRWDLYMVIIPFTLHPLEKANTFYERFVFSIDLDQSTEAISHDLFPKKVLASTSATTKYTVSPMGKFQPFTPDSALPYPPFALDILHPKILAFGEGDKNFYWRYEDSGDGKGVIPETKHALLVLRVPTGTTTVSGTFHCKATLSMKLFQSLTYRKNAIVNTFPFRWDLSARSRLASTLAAKTSLFDVCLVCALAEEAQALLIEISRHCDVTFQEGYSPTLKSEYRHTTIQNRYGETLRVLVSWQSGPGAIETGLHVKSLVQEMQPRFVGMTGICAGDPDRVALGDLVVAERSFLYDTGTLLKDPATGRTLYQHNTTTWQLHRETLQTLRMFTSWQALVADLPRPVSSRQQRDWLLTTLSQSNSHRLEDIPMQDLQRNAPLWRKIYPTLQIGENPFLSPDRTLIDPQRIAKLYYGRDEFPYHDPALPEVHIQPIASGSTERADNPFAEIRYPVQGTVAIDLEGAAFYRTLADFPEVPSLLVKGVCDYAGSFRDEAYRTYASRISAAYMLGFLQAYVRRE